MFFSPIFNELSSTFFVFQYSGNNYIAVDQLFTSDAILCQDNKSSLPPATGELQQIFIIASTKRIHKDVLLEY